jgi:hypothetical protein
MINFEEISMNQADAENLLNLGRSWTSNDLTTSFNHLVKVNRHDVDIVQKLKLAKRLLNKLGASGEPDFSETEEWNELHQRKAKSELLKRHIQMDIESKYPAEAFVAYFKRIFPTNKFEYTKTIGDMVDTAKATVKYTFQNVRKDKAFEVEIYTFIPDLLNVDVIANEELPYPISISAYAYKNQRKISVMDGDWKMAGNQAEITPDVIFPKSKIVGIEGRKFSARDMMLFVKNELSAISGKTQNEFYIPLKDGTFLRVKRLKPITQISPAKWAINGIYIKDQQNNFTSKIPLFGFLYENEDSAKLLKSWKKKSGKQIKIELSQLEK